MRPWHFGILLNLQRELQRVVFMDVGPLRQLRGEGHLHATDLWL